MKPSGLRLGVDLGGTKIEGIVLAPDGAQLWRERRPTPAGDYEGTIGAIADLVAVAERSVGASASVGIGMPGAVSLRTGLVKNANSTVLNGRPFQRDLEARLQRPVRLQNDANCFAFSEAVDGAGAHADSVFGVILGTGVGGGIVIGRRLLVGADAIAGEWGHNPLPPAAQLGLRDEGERAFARAEAPGPACYCGCFGCVETWLSGPGFAADHARVTGTPVPDAAAIVAAMRAGDRAARASFERYVDRLARALATVINIVDPQCIVLGGGISRIDELYRQLPQRLPRYVFSDDLRTQVVPPLHGDSSGVRGAAWLWD